MTTRRALPPTDPKLLLERYLRACPETPARHTALASLALLTARRKESWLDLAESQADRIAQMRSELDERDAEIRRLVKDLLMVQPFLADGGFDIVPAAMQRQIGASSLKRFATVTTAINGAKKHNGGPYNDGGGLR